MPSQPKHQHPKAGKPQPKPLAPPGQSASRRKKRPTQKAFRPPVPPSDPEGRRYTQFFNHGFKPIYAYPPKPGEKPSWFSKDHNHPLEPRVLWKHFKDKEIYLGIRFGSQTKYVMIDIDSTSPYHPEKSGADFKKILDALESLGFGLPVAIRSSWSGGIHIYYGFREPLSTYHVALCVTKCLVDAGFKLKSGWLEIFPNPKSFDRNRITDYKAHALPLQAGRGSILLQIETWFTEAEVRPAGLYSGEEYSSNQVKLFNDLMEESAATSDLRKLKKKLEVAYSQKSKYQECYNNLVLSEKAAEWKSELTYMISEGFTSKGQTNWLLHKIGVLGLVFEHLEGDDLISYMYDTVTNAPGYQAYCSHQHEIERRCKEWAKCISETGYYCKYRGFPPRGLMSYERMLSKVSQGTNKNPLPKPPKQNLHNINQAAEAHEKIINAIASLQQQGKYPFGKAVRMMAIIGKTKELYGVGVSRRTLYKPENLRQWNPEYEIPDPWEENQLQPQKSNQPVLQVIQELQKPAIAGLLPPAESPNQEQISSDGCKPYGEAFLTYPIKKIPTYHRLEPAQGGISHLPNVYEGLLPGLRLSRPLHSGKARRPSENLAKSAFQPLGDINLPTPGNYGLWSLLGVTGKTLGCPFDVNQIPASTEIPKFQQPGSRQSENHQDHQKNDQAIDCASVVDEEAYQPGVTILARGVHWKVIEKVGATAAHLLVEESNGRKEVFHNYVSLAQYGLIKLIEPQPSSQQPEEKQSQPLTDESEQEFLDWYTLAVSRGWIEKVRDYRRLPIVSYQGQLVRVVFAIERIPFGKPRKVIKPWLQVKDKYLD